MLADERIGFANMDSAANLPNQVVDHDAPVGIARGNESDFDSRPPPPSPGRDCPPIGANTVTMQARVATRAAFACHFPMPLGGSSLARAQECGLACPCAQQVSLTSGVSDPLASAYGSVGHLPSRSASALAGVQGDAR
jgi:hypothetical protein